MGRASLKPNAPAVSPLRVFLLVLVLVFVVEGLIMLTVLDEEGLTPHAVGRATLDSVLLTAILAPMLWVLVVRPLRSLLDQRGELLTRVLDVQEEERGRLSRDLHDELGQLLTATILNLRAAEAAGDTEEVRRLAAHARVLASSSLDATRRIARGLAPVVLADFGLRAAVERMCEDLRAASALDVTAEMNLPDGRLRPAVEIAAYRILQEATTNAVRHADATSIRIMLAIEEAALRLEVHDNGKGVPAGAWDPARGGSGLGLSGMRERAALLGGELRVTCRPGEGTIIVARIPDALTQP